MIFESAGILGIDPRPWSIHELMMMRRGCEMEEWDRLAYLISSIATVAGAKNVKFEKFHKFLSTEGPQVVKPVSSMKKIFRARV